MKLEMCYIWQTVGITVNGDKYIDSYSYSLSHVTNPYKHLETSSKQGGSRENFFETTVTSYDTAGSLSGWDEI